MQLKMEEDGFVEKLISDEATFHICGKVNRHNDRIWEIEQSHAQIEHRCDSPKVNIFCAVSCDKVHGPFFFTEATDWRLISEHVGKLVVTPTEYQI
jgi:hypothetical protein